MDFQDDETQATGTGKNPFNANILKGGKVNPKSKLYQRSVAGREQLKDYLQRLWDEGGDEADVFMAGVKSLMNRGHGYVGAYLDSKNPGRTYEKNQAMAITDQVMKDEGIGEHPGNRLTRPKVADEEGKVDREATKAAREERKTSNQLRGTFGPKRPEGFEPKKAKSVRQQRKEGKREGTGQPVKGTEGWKRGDLQPEVEKQKREEGRQDYYYAGSTVPKEYVDMMKNSISDITRRLESGEITKEQAMQETAKVRDNAVSKARSERAAVEKEKAGLTPEQEAKRKKSLAKKRGKATGEGMPEDTAAPEEKEIKPIIDGVGIRESFKDYYTKALKRTGLDLKSYVKSVSRTGAFSTDIEDIINEIKDKGFDVDPGEFKKAVGRSFGVNLDNYPGWDSGIEAKPELEKSSTGAQLEEEGTAQPEPQAQAPGKRASSQTPQGASNVPEPEAPAPEKQKPKEEAAGQPEPQAQASTQQPTSSPQVKEEAPVKRPVTSKGGFKAPSQPIRKEGGGGFGGGSSRVAVQEKPEIMKAGKTAPTLEDFKSYLYTKQGNLFGKRGFDTNPDAEPFPTGPEESAPSSDLPGATSSRPAPPTAKAGQPGQQGLFRAGSLTPRTGRGFGSNVPKPPAQPASRYDYQPDLFGGGGNIESKPQEPETETQQAGGREQGSGSLFVSPETARKRGVKRTIDTESGPVENPELYTTPRRGRGYGTSGSQQKEETGSNRGSQRAATPRRTRAESQRIRDEGKQVLEDIRSQSAKAKEVQERMANSPAGTGNPVPRKRTVLDQIARGAKGAVDAVNRARDRHNKSAGGRLFQVSEKDNGTQMSYDEFAQSVRSLMR